VEPRYHAGGFRNPSPPFACFSTRRRFDAICSLRRGKSCGDGVARATFVLELGTSKKYRPRTRPLHSRTRRDRAAARSTPGRSAPGRMALLSYPRPRPQDFPGRKAFTEDWKSEDSLAPGGRDAVVGTRFEMLAGDLLGGARANAKSATRLSVLPAGPRRLSEREPSART